MNQLDGKVALVTGGASGIGEATVEAFLAEGARVVAVDLQADRLTALSERLGSSGSLATVAADLSTGEKAVDAAKEATEKFGTIDVLVNVAGLHDAGVS